MGLKSDNRSLRVHYESKRLFCPTSSQPRACSKPAIAAALLVGPPTVIWNCPIGPASEIVGPFFVQRSEIRGQRSELATFLALILRRGDASLPLFTYVVVTVVEK